MKKEVEREVWTGGKQTERLTSFTRATSPAGGTEGQTAVVALHFLDTPRRGEKKKKKQKKTKKKRTPKGAEETRRTGPDQTKIYRRRRERRKSLSLLLLLQVI